MYNSSQVGLGSGSQPSSLEATYDKHLKKRSGVNILPQWQEIIPIALSCGSAWAGLIHQSHHHQHNHNPL